MLNISFNAGNEIYLSSLWDRCVHENLEAVYDADVYPGAKVKIPEGPTILIFHSGSILVTGAKAVSQAVEAHARITALLEAHPAILKKK